MALVQPFYLDMMRDNATRAADDILDEVARTASAVTDGEILELLSLDWRPRVMGAWYATTRSGPRIAEAVLESLDTCLGSLTSPPLVTATLVHAAPTAVEHLRTYVERDVSNRWGGAGVAAAALERLGAPVAEGIAEDHDRHCLAALVAIAAGLGQT